jgi:hypothetical protein
VAAARGRPRKMMTTTTTSGWLTGSPQILTVSSALDRILFLFPCSFTNLVYVGCNNKIKTEIFSCGVGALAMKMQRMHDRHDLQINCQNQAGTCFFSGLGLFLERRDSCFVNGRRVLAT